jgi:hypothetical protein
MTLPGDQPNALVTRAYDQAAAVVSDFMNPFGLLGAWPEQWEARLNESRPEGS